MYREYAQVRYCSVLVDASDYVYRQSSGHILGLRNPGICLPKTVMVDKLLRFSVEISFSFLVH